MHIIPAAFYLIPDCFKTQEMCIKAVEADLWELDNVPDCFKTQKMCVATVSEDPYSLQHFPDWFVTQGQVRKLRDDDNYCDDDEITEWYDDYKKHKAQKAEIKEELMTTA